MRAIVIPQDLTKPMVEVEGSNYRDLVRTHSNIDFLERVNTAQLATLGLVFAVDEEFLSKPTHRFNKRATMIARYRGYPLRGDVVVFTEAMSADGVTFFSVPPTALELLQGVAGMP